VSLAAGDDHCLKAHFRCQKSFQFAPKVDKRLRML
jgi:hypothetical protein